MNDYDNNDPNKIFPTRWGSPQGHGNERTMLDKAGDVSGFRTIIQSNPDGSTTMLKTRGGMPTFLTSVVNKLKSVEVVLVKVARTFVFNLLTKPISKTAKVAYRGEAAGSMVVSSDNIVVGAATYFMTLIKTSPQTGTPVKWYDVIRLDYEPSNRIVRINGGDVTGVFPDNDITMFPDYGSRFCLPFVWTIDVGGNQSYQPSIPGSSPQRSVLFLGFSTAQTRKLYSLAVNGDGLSYLEPSYASQMHQISSAGLRLNDKTGEYGFYGGRCASYHPAVGSAFKSLSYASWCYSECKAGKDYPYISELISGTGERFTLNTDVVVPGTCPAVVSEVLGPPSYTGIIVTVLETPTVTFNQVGLAPEALNISWPGGLATGLTEPGLNYAGQVQPAGYDSVKTATSSVISDHSIPQYAFIGSKVEMALDASFIFNASQIGVGKLCAWKYYSGNPVSFTEHATNKKDADSTSTTNVALRINGLPLLSDVTTNISDVQRYLSAGHWVEEPYYQAASGPFIEITGYLGSAVIRKAELESAPKKTWVGRHGSMAIDADIDSRNYLEEVISKTRDFIYADIEEEVFLYLECSSEIRKRVVAAKNVDVIYSGEGCFVDVQYVLEVRGQRNEFPVVAIQIPYDYGFELQKNGITFSGDGYTIGDIYGAYHQGNFPPPIWNPRFMHQGNCPYIAYTTKAEEANGANPEIYLDMKIRIMRYEDLTSGTMGDTTEFDVGLDEGLVKFAPHQFINIHNKYLCCESKTTGKLTINTTLWSQIFPTGQDKRLQFYNGTIGAVASKLGAGFSGDPLIDISRI